MAQITSRRRRRRKWMGLNEDDDNEWSSDPEIDALLNEVLKLQVDCSPPPVPERWRTPDQPDEDTPSLIKLILSIRDRVKQAQNVRLKILMEKADVNETDRCGRTPLMYACSQGNSATVQALLTEKDKVDVLTTDMRLNTALMYACAAGYDDLVWMLLDFVRRRLDSQRCATYDVLQNFIDAENDRCETAASLAYEQGHIDCIQVISTFVTLCSKHDKKSGLSTFIRKATKNLLRGVSPSARKDKEKQEDRRSSMTAGSYTYSSKRSSYDSDSGVDTKDSTWNNGLHRLTIALAEVLEKKIVMRSSRVQKSRSMTNLNSQKIYDLFKNWDT